MRKRTYEVPFVGVVSCTLYGDITLVQGSGDIGTSGNEGAGGGDGIYAKPRFMDGEEASEDNADAPYSLDHTSLWDD